MGRPNKYIYNSIPFVVIQKTLVGRRNDKVLRSTVVRPTKREYLRLTNGTVGKQKVDTYGVLSGVNVDKA